MDKIREAIRDEAQSIVSNELAGTLARIAETFAVAAKSVQVEQPVDIHGAAEFMNVSPQSIRNWLNKPPKPTNPLPCMKAGSELRFLRSELNAWMRRNAMDLKAVA